MMSTIFDDFLQIFTKILLGCGPFEDTKRHFEINWHLITPNNVPTHELERAESTVNFCEINVGENTGSHFCNSGLSCDFFWVHCISVLKMLNVKLEDLKLSTVTKCIKTAKNKKDKMELLFDKCLITYERNFFIHIPLPPLCGKSLGLSNTECIEWKVANYELK